MARSARSMAVLAAFSILVIAGSAQAQMLDPSLSHEKPPTAPAVKPQPLAWPRLDSGAVLCRTEDDLNRLARRRSGESVDGAIDCQVIRHATPITIVHRKGPRTEVSTNVSGIMPAGWTDAYLPDKAPPGK